MIKTQKEKEDEAIDAICSCVMQGNLMGLSDQGTDVPWPALIGSGNAVGLVSLSHFASKNALSMRDIDKCHKKADDVLAMIFGWALRDGQHQAFTLVEMPLTTDGFQSFPEPVNILIEKGMVKSLTKFLDSGFDPTLKWGSKAQSALELAAHLHQNDVVNTMNSHRARGRAHDLITEIESESATPTVPSP